MIDPKYLLGWLLIIINLISALAVFSQVRLTHQRKNTIGLSFWPWFMGTTNSLVGGIYSLMIADIFFVIANLAWLSANGTMLFLMIYYGRAAKNTTGVNNP